MRYSITLDKDGYVQNIYRTGNPRIDVYELNLSRYDLTGLRLHAYRIGKNRLIFDENRYNALVEEEERKIREKEIAEEEEKLKSDKVNMLTDMLTIHREPSDKLGYDFEVYMLGDVILRKEYVKNDSHSGTMDDPIPFELGLSLIPNAFYSYESHLWVYMGQGGVIADEYPVDEVNGWVFWE